MLETVRAALRIKSTAFDEEINGLIDACLKDLSLAGAENVSVSDALTQRAVILYCKANFGYYEDAEKYAERYRALKITMANSSDYGEED